MIVICKDHREIQEIPHLHRVKKRRAVDSV